MGDTISSKDNTLTQEQLEWLVADADRCAGIVADAYAGWDTDVPWREALAAEIEHRRRHP